MQEYEYLDYLYHHGVKGMKWGIRRARKNVSSSPSRSKSDQADDKETTNKKGLSDKQKTALKVGAAAVGTALAVYGTYKVSKFANEHVRGTKVVKDLFDDLDSDSHMTAKELLNFNREMAAYFNQD